MAAESESMSVDTSTENPDEHLQDLTDEQLEQLLSDTVHANEVLATETQMFEKFLKRVEPKSDGMAAAGGGYSQRQNSGSLANLSDSGTGSRLGRKRSKSRVSAIERMLRLNFEQKCEIAQRELEDYADKVRLDHEESEKEIDGLKAKLEEADMRLNEIKKEEYEFERDIVKGANNPRTGKPVSEKVMKYLDDKLKAKEALIVKLRLKNTALKVQKRKLQTQLRQKEEMGEVLMEVDFSQLKIENQQYIEKIDERNQELLKLKMMAGSTLQVLNSYKKKLNTMTMESSRIKADIDSRHELLARIDVESKVVDEERLAAEKINRKLRQQLADYRVPEIMEYVGVKSDLYELSKKVQSWERKVEIASMALKASQKTWQQLKTNASDMNAQQSQLQSLSFGGVI